MDTNQEKGNTSTDNTCTYVLADMATADRACALPIQVITKLSGKDPMRIEGMCRAVGVGYLIGKYGQDYHQAVNSIQNSSTKVQVMTWEEFTKIS